MSDENTPDAFASEHRPSDAPKDAADAGERKTVEAWAEAKKHAGREAWKFAVAKAFKQWPEGAEVTETDYDAAVKEASGQTLGLAPPRETRSLTEWAKDDPALRDRIAVYQGWPYDQALTEAEFQTAASLVRTR